MADVKVPPMLHKMSVSAQKAWYKKNKMEYPGAGGKEGRSAAQAKKDVGEINKKKAREAAIARAAASKKNKALVSSSERVREMGRRRRESGEGLGGGLETNRDIISYVRAGGTIKAGRLGENLEEGRMKDIDTDRKETARLAAQEKEPPFTPDKNPVRRGRGGPMSQAKWLAKQAMMKKMKQMGMKEGVESVEEGLLDKAKTVAKNISGIVNPKTPEEKAKSIQRSAQASFYTSRLKRDDANRKAAGMKPLSGIDRLKTKADGLKRAAEPYVKAALKGVKEEAEQTDEAIRVKDISVSNTLGSLKKAKPNDNFIAKDHARITRSIAAHDVKSVRKKTAGNPDMRKAALKRAGYAVVKEVAEEPKHSDAGEYDYEGDMAKSQLRSIMTNAKRMHDMLEDNTNLPEWVQSKVTLAEDYVLTAANYMEGEMNEEIEAVDEKMNLATTKMGDVIKDFQKSDAPQFKGKSMEKRREMAIAAKLGAEREVKEDVEAVEEKYMGFKKVMAAAKEGGARDPAAVAAAIGRKKYGKEKFQAAAAAGKKMSEALDPVGREDKDIDNDGDSDKTDVYLSKRRKAIGSAIRKKVADKMGK